MYHVNRLSAIIKLVNGKFTLYVGSWHVVCFYHFHHLYMFSLSRSFFFSPYDEYTCSLMYHVICDSLRRSRFDTELRSVYSTLAVKLEDFKDQV